MSMVTTSLFSFVSIAVVTNTDSKAAVGDDASSLATTWSRWTLPFEHARAFTVPFLFSLRNMSDDNVPFFSLSLRLFASSGSKT
jgi:hypothetical protein